MAISNPGHYRPHLPFIPIAMHITYVYYNSTRERKEKEKKKERKRKKKEERERRKEERNNIIFPKFFVFHILISLETY